MTVPASENPNPTKRLEMALGSRMKKDLAPLRKIHYELYKTVLETKHMYPELVGYEANA